MQDDFRERVDMVDTFHMEKISEMREIINEVKTMARDSVNKKQEELTEMVNEEVSKLTRMVDGGLDAIVGDREEAMSRNAMMFEKMKVVCCEFFDKYD